MADQNGPRAVASELLRRSGSTGCVPDEVLDYTPLTLRQPDGEHGGRPVLRA